MKNIIFIAPPAAGKGTMSKLIHEEFGIPHISTGDLLRDEKNSGSELGEYIKGEIDNGRFVSNEVITKLLENRLKMNDVLNGYILDGYPRNIEQAKIYEELLKKLGYDLGIVIFLDIDKEVALNRVLYRKICSNCGMSYNLKNENLKPKNDGICDKCNSKLETRNDDTVETFENRFDTYLEKTQGLIDYYANKGVLEKVRIDGDSEALDTYKKIKRLLK